MEKQHKLVVEILRRFSNSGILKHVLLIGSWSAFFYQDYFQGILYAPVLRTRDIDFLVPTRVHFPKEVDLGTLLADLGFEVEFSAPSGLMKLESDELILEFLAPEVGPPKTKPQSLPQLKFNVQSIRHLSMLWRAPITVKISGIEVNLPHPADYCLHKLFIHDRRKNLDKKAKDLESAFLVLEALREKEGINNLTLAYKNLSKKEQKQVSTVLTKHGYNLLGIG